MAQATSLASLLEPLVGPVEIVKIKTSGDAGNRERLGAFVSEIRDAVLDGSVDLGLHCLKDIPTVDVPGLAFAAYLEREDPSETVITGGPSWLDLHRGAVIGTGSLRRTSQLAFYRPDLAFRPLVGNVDTRLGKLLAGEYDGIVLAIAGLKRLGLLEGWERSRFGGLRVERLSLHQVLPAPAQAVLVIESREDDLSLRDQLSSLDHAETRVCAVAERSFLKHLGTGCSLPVAAWASIKGDVLELEGLVAAPDGARVMRGTRAGQVSCAETIGIDLAKELGERGAYEIIASLKEVKSP